MSDVQDGRASPDRPALRGVPSRWPGIVWAVPLAAAVVAGYLGLGAYAQRGIDVVVTFPSGAGVKAGSTRVIYQGIEAGRVTDLQLNQDGHSVDMTLRLIPRAKPALVTGTIFYFIGAGNDLTDVASLHAALAGVSIGVIPSFAGTSTRHFSGLQAAPVVSPNVAGLPITLTVADPGSIQPGNNVTYHGIEVGKVTSVRLTGLQSAEIGTFIKAPYDSFVRPDSTFYDVGALRLAASGQGISAQVNPAAIFHGEVAFDTPALAKGEPRVSPGSRFQLFPDREHAESAPSGPQVLYRTRFDIPVAGLDTGSRVTWHGLSVGFVKNVEFAFDGSRGTMATLVTFAVSPRLLRLDTAAPQSGAYWRRRIDAAMSSIVEHGWRLRVSQSPPLFGAHTLDLEMSTQPGHIQYEGPYPLVPSEDVGSANLAEKATHVLDAVDHIPFAAIGENVRRMTASLGSLVASPEVRDGIHHADRTLAQADAMMTAVRPQIGPLLTKLNATADQLQALSRNAERLVGEEDATEGNIPQAVKELSEAARSVRSLSDYLSRHPEAIVRGKAKER